MKADEIEKQNISIVVAFGAGSVGDYGPLMNIVDHIAGHFYWADIIFHCPEPEFDWLDKFLPERVNYVLEYEFLPKSPDLLILCQAFYTDRPNVCNYYNSVAFNGCRVVSIEFRYDDQIMYESNLHETEGLNAGTMTISEANEHHQKVARDLTTIQYYDDMMKEGNICMINAFPLDLLGKEDFNAIHAFLVPWIPPKNIFEGNESSSSMTLASLDTWVNTQRQQGSSIACVAIGGKNATRAEGDQQTHLINEYLLKRNNLAVIYLNTPPTTDSIQSERVFCIKGRQLYLPRVFRYVDVIISHGGTGTIGCSLQSGVPSVILPTNCGDQVQNGRMIQDRNLGILATTRCIIDGVLQLDGETISCAVWNILDQSIYKEEARKFRGKLENGLERTANILCQLMGKLDKS
ncbi:hypothetical protein V500_02652 [Pseudogymnoascus sp. VKM F-4518 (FW-2643)]|nr:hypothetical protein V500_02652 [Pseudogymnoascus sp. VKM F-4518 (FW-2643)]